jgi:hypothetical protein
MALFPAEEHAVVRELRGTDADRLTPLEALQLVHAWRAALDSPGAKQAAG